MAENTAGKLQRVTVVKYGNESKDMVRGTAELIPNPFIDMGKVYNLQGLGAFFSGNYYCTNVTHTFDSNGYKQQGEFIKQSWDGSAEVVVGGDETGIKVISQDNPRQPRPVAPPSPAKSSQRTYIVAKGDTLWAISKKFYGDATKWKVIEKANHDALVAKDRRDLFDSGHWIYPGQKIIIP